MQASPRLSRDLILHVRLALAPLVVVSTGTLLDPADAPLAARCRSL